MRPRAAREERTPILVVDDDPHARRHVRDALAAAGYAQAATGEPGQVSRLVEAKHPLWCCWTWCCRAPTASS